MREYTIPKNYKRFFNKDFLELFKKNLEEVFHRKYLSAYDWYDEIGTNGWYRALNMTCCEKGCLDIISYYDSLDWNQSDDFDAELIDIAIDCLGL